MLCLCGSFRPIVDSIRDLGHRGWVVTNKKPTKVNMVYVVPSSIQILPVVMEIQRDE